MVDKHIDLNIHNYNIENKPNNISCLIFGDIHYSLSFDLNKLDKITSCIDYLNPTYLCLTGDIINKGNTWYNNKEYKEKLLSWLKYLSYNYKLFLTLGNHDIAKETFNSNDINTKLWNYLSTLDNIYISHYNPFYIDDNVVIYQLELSQYYYFNKGNTEDADYLITYLEENNKYLTNLPKDKIKILMCHSPINITNSKVLKLIKEYDFIFTGHMHNGMMPLVLDKLVKNNIGIISPQRTLFPPLSRGVKELSIIDNDHSINLIINGGITKLQETSGFLKNFNFLYPMSIDEININKEKKLKK